MSFTRALWPTNISAFVVSTPANPLTVQVEVVLAKDKTAPFTQIIPMM